MKRPLYCHPPETLLNYNFLISNTTNLGQGQRRASQSRKNTDDQPSNNEISGFPITTDKPSEGSPLQIDERFLESPDKSQNFNPEKEESEDESILDYQLRSQSDQLSHDIY